MQELHTKLVLGRHPLGRPILGREATIQSLKRQDLLEYIDTHYRPSQIVLAVAGNFDQQQWKGWSHGSLARRSRSNGVSRPVRRPPEVRGGVLVKQKPLEQVHLCVGLKGVAAGHRGPICRLCAEQCPGRKCEFAAVPGNP